MCYVVGSDVFYFSGDNIVPETNFKKGDKQEDSPEEVKKQVQKMSDESIAEFRSEYKATHKTDITSDQAQEMYEHWLNYAARELAKPLNRSKDAEEQRIWMKNNRADWIRANPVDDGIEVTPKDNPETDK